MGPDKRKKEYQKKNIIRVNSMKVLLLKGQEYLILIILILKKFSRIFHPFLFSPVFSIFIIVYQDNRKINYKNIKINMETIFKDTSANIANQNNANLILKIINT